METDIKQRANMVLGIKFLLFNLNLVKILTKISNTCLHLIKKFKSKYSIGIFKNLNV